MKNIFKSCFGLVKKSDRDRCDAGEHIAKFTDDHAVRAYRRGDCILETDAGSIRSTVDERPSSELNKWNMTEDTASIYINLKPGTFHRRQISSLMYATAVMALYHTERVHVRSLRSHRDRCIKRLENLTRIAPGEMKEVVCSMDNLIRFQELVKRSLQKEIEMDKHHPRVGHKLLRHLTSGGDTCLQNECLRILENRDCLLALTEQNGISIQPSQDVPASKPGYSKAILKDFVDEVMDRVNNYIIMIKEILRHTDDSGEMKYLQMCTKAAATIYMRMKFVQARKTFREKMSPLARQLFYKAVSLKYESSNNETEQELDKLETSLSALVNSRNVNCLSDVGKTLAVSQVILTNQEVCTWNDSQQMDSKYSTVNSSRDVNMFQLASSVLPCTIPLKLTTLVVPCIIPNTRCQSLESLNHTQHSSAMVDHVKDSSRDRVKLLTTRHLVLDRVHCVSMKLKDKTYHRALDITSVKSQVSVVESVLQLCVLGECQRDQRNVQLVISRLGRQAQRLNGGINVITNVIRMHVHSIQSSLAILSPFVYDNLCDIAHFVCWLFRL